MKIIKIAQGNIQRFIRFDKDARIEIFIEPYEFQTELKYDEIIARTDISDEQKITILKEMCAGIAHEKLNQLNVSDSIKITVDGLSIKDINMDRINWDHILHPEIEE